MDCVGGSLLIGGITAPPGVWTSGWSYSTPWQPSSTWQWGTTALMKRWDSNNRTGWTVLAIWNRDEKRVAFDYYIMWYYHRLLTRLLDYVSRPLLYYWFEALNVMFCHIHLYNIYSYSIQSVSRKQVLHSTAVIEQLAVWWQWWSEAVSGCSQVRFLGLLLAVYRCWLGCQMWAAAMQRLCWVFWELDRRKSATLCWTEPIPSPLLLCKTLTGSLRWLNTLFFSV